MIYDLGRSSCRSTGFNLHFQRKSMIQLPTSLLNGSLPNRPIQGWEHDIYTVILMDPKSSRCLGSDVKKKKILHWELNISCGKDPKRKLILSTFGEDYCRMLTVYSNCTLYIVVLLGGRTQITLMLHHHFTRQRQHPQHRRSQLSV